MSHSCGFIHCLKITSLTILGVLTIVACGSNTETNPIEDLKTDRTFSNLNAPGALRIVTDDLGVRHIYGEGLETTVFGQGYITAHDRLWQMDLLRRLAKGSLGGLVGELALELDMEMRGSMLTRDGTPLEQALSRALQEKHPEPYALMQAYADGINAFIADIQQGHNDAELPPEYEFPFVAKEAKDLVPWKVEDTYAIARLQAWFLSASNHDEVRMGEFHSALSAEVFADLFRFAPPARATTLAPVANQSARYSPEHVETNVTTAQIPAQSLDQRAVAAKMHDADVRRSAVLPMFNVPREVIGSNNWIITADKSTSGNTLLANDPHLEMTNPPIWHVVHLNPNYKLDKKTYPASQGVSFPGIPGIILGYNDHISWGGTVAGYDVTDVYLETVHTPDNYPNSPRTVLYNGKQVPVIRKVFDFDLGTAGTAQKAIEIVPHHGPMMPDPDIEDDVDGLAATNMSFRWVGHEVSYDARFILNMLTATSVQEVRDALQYFTVGAQNWVVADRHGDVSYYPRADIPIRPAGVVPYLPVTGTGEAEWLASGSTPTWLSDNLLPQATNPVKGYLATANTDLQGELLDNNPLNDRAYLYWDRANGFRLERIQQRLEARLKEKGTINLKDMGEIQTDVYSKEAEYSLPALLNSIKGTSLTAAQQEAVQRLEKWLDDDFTPLNTHAGLDAGINRDDLGDPIEVTDNDRDDAVATTLFYAWLSRMISETFDDEMAQIEMDTPRGASIVRALIHLLNDEDQSGLLKIHAKDSLGQSLLWDNRATTTVVESKADIALTSLAAGLNDMSLWFGTDNQAKWLWGKVHILKLSHALDVAPGGSKFNVGETPIPLSGARSTVSPAGFNIGGALVEKDEYLVSPWGPSKRFIIEMDQDGPIAWDSIPGGQLGYGTDEDSFDTLRGLYGNWLGDWLRGRRFKYHFHNEEVANNAIETWSLQ